MDLRRLSYFVEACDRGSLTAASLAIDVAQPALSRQIRELEREMGVELLHRTGRGVAPTYAGRHLLDGARRLLAESEKLREDVRALAGATAGEAVIGMPPTVGRVLTVPLTRMLAARHPQLSLRIMEGFSGTMLEALQAGRIDLAILYENPRLALVIADPVAEEELVVVGAAANPRLEPAIRWSCPASIIRCDLSSPGARSTRACACRCNMRSIRSARCWSWWPRALPSLFCPPSRWHATRTASG